MGGGGGSVSSNTRYQRAATPSVYKPVAPDRTLATPVPDNIEQGMITQGYAMTDKEKEKKTRGLDALIIPMSTTETAQTGGVDMPSAPTGVV